MIFFGLIDFGGPTDHSAIILLFKYSGNQFIIHNWGGGTG